MSGPRRSFPRSFLDDELDFKHKNMIELRDLGRWDVRVRTLKELQDLRARNGRLVDALRCSGCPDHIIEAIASGEAPTPQPAGAD